MAHSENSKIINDYIKLYQKGNITLEGLWYNIQTPLHILFQKEERVQVQEKRNQEQEKRIQEQEKRIQEQERDIDILNTEYKQKEAALTHFVQFGNSLKEEIIELKKQLDTLKKESKNVWFW